MQEEALQAGDAQSRGANVSALATKSPARGREAVIGPEGDSAATKQVEGCRLSVESGLEDGPAEGAVADIESELEVRMGNRGGHKYDLLDAGMF